MMVTVLKGIKEPQLNNILQKIEICELSIGDGQRAAD